MTDITDMHTRPSQGAAKHGDRARVTRRWFLSFATSGAFFLGTNLAARSASSSTDDLSSTRWPAQALASPHPPPDRTGALVLYDDSGPYEPLSQVYATLAASLASHFGRTTTRGLSRYTAGDLVRHPAAIYVGTNTYEQLPQTFLDDVRTGATPVLWLHGNLDQLGTPSASLGRTYGWAWQRADSQQARTVLYKSASLSRSPANAGPLAAVRVTDRARTSVLATAVHDDGSTVPWAVRSGHITYVAEVPLDASDVADDRYLALCDLLFDLLEPTARERHRALVRLEDINPTSDPNRLHKLAEVLRAEGVPYSFALYPVHVGPIGAPRQTLKLSERPAVVRAVAFMLQHGGTMVLHGYTHQFGDLRNPDTGESGIDFEFFRVHRDAQGGLVYDSPVPGDSASWATRRLRAAVHEITSTGLPTPRMLEFPHYAASTTDYAATLNMFDARYDRPQYFSHAWKRGPMNPYMFEQFAPYVVRDAYGSVLVPENLGYVQGPPVPTEGIGSLGAIVEGARANLVVRDGVASFFYHPYLPISGLRSIVSRLRALGYEFVAPGEL